MSFIDGRTLNLVSILWRRLDLPGHDACRLVQTSRGWRLEGHAVFLQQHLVAALGYRIESDRAWRTRKCLVQGWFGPERRNFRIEHRAGRWTLNGQLFPGLGECIDLDLGFTPATNLLTLRRMALAEGEAVSLPAVWFDLTEKGLTVLHQRYERRSDHIYWYEAPQYRYAAPLQVSTEGFIEDYPGLWRAETIAGPL